MAKKFISLAISFVMIFSFVFVANADEGIILGYNASFGWKAYGMGGETRHVKMIVVDEDDPRNPEIYSKTYTELTGEKGGIGPIDFISPWTYNLIINNTIGKIVAFIFSELTVHKSANKKRVKSLNPDSLFCFASDRNPYGETAFEKISVHPMPVWWT